MVFLPHSTYIILIFSLFAIKSVCSIYCYQCSGTDSSNPFLCNEHLGNSNELELHNCSNINNANFCVKYTGRFEGIAIECIQCNSSTTMECGDGLMHLDRGVLVPASCEHVFNAQYCVKMTGGISTKRFCSSLDLGTYCNYAKQTGDKLEYRTCIYTCSTDGCNAASKTSLSFITLILGLTILSKTVYF